MQIKLVRPLGQRFWEIEFEGPYEEQDYETMKIELQTKAEIGKSNKKSSHDKVKTGQIYKLSGLHRQGQQIAWIVDGLMKNNGADRVVFVVGHGKWPLSKFLPINENAMEDVFTEEPV